MHCGKRSCLLLLALIAVPPIMLYIAPERLAHVNPLSALPWTHTVEIVNKVSIDVFDRSGLVDLDVADGTPTSDDQHDKVQMLQSKVLVHSDTLVPDNNGAGFLLDSEAFPMVSDGMPPAPTPAGPVPPVPGSFSMVSGNCTIVNSGTCVQSPRYPYEYMNYQSCVINPPAGLITTVDFNTESFYDRLIVNGRLYNGTHGPPTQVVTSQITWTSDMSVTRKGWQLCKASVPTAPPATPVPTSPPSNGSNRTNGTVPSPPPVAPAPTSTSTTSTTSTSANTSTTTSTPAPPAPGSFSKVSGDCTIVNSGTCVQSPGYPSAYSNSQSCVINPPAGLITTVDFKTESFFDKLFVNGWAYSGAYRPPTMAITGQITWTSDRSETRTGWQLCKASVPTAPPATPVPTSPPSNGSNRTNGTVPSPPPIAPAPTSTSTTSTTSTSANTITTTSTPAPPAPGSFSKVSGDCTIVNSGTCVQSPRYPYEYLNYQSCVINPPAGLITTVDFNTETFYDRLIVNGRLYNGTHGPPTQVVTSQITWTSDMSATRKGWQLCKASVPTAPPATPVPTSPPSNGTNRTNGTVPAPPAMPVPSRRLRGPLLLVEDV